MSEQSVIQKSRELRKRAQALKDTPFTAHRMAETIDIGREALLLNEQLEARSEALEHELGMLTTMVYDAVETSLRDTIGFDWMKAFPSRSKASRHFQALHAIARYLKRVSQPQ